MEFRVTRREMLAGCLLGGFAMSVPPMRAFGASLTDTEVSIVSELDKFTNANEGDRAGNASGQVAGTPYECVLASNGGNTDMTVDELKDFVVTRERTRYEVRGLVTRPDVLDRFSKMYSASDTDPSKYIVVDFDKPIDEPKNHDTEEMTLYLEPRYVSKDSGVINCNGSVQVPDAGMSCISASFDEVCQITQCIYAATITVEGYISRWSLQDHSSGYRYYYLYSDARALIDEDSSRRITLKISKDVEITEGSKVRATIINIQDIDNDHYDAYVSHLVEL